MSYKPKCLACACIVLVACVFLWAGTHRLYSQETNTSTSQEQEKKKVETDKPGKTTVKGKEQTPAQTAAKRREAEAREKALAKAKAEAKAEARGEAATKTQTEDGEYVYTNVLLLEKASPEQAVTPNKTKAYWQGLKIALDKQLLEAKETLTRLEENLLSTRMEYLRESSPLRQNELQQQINQLIADITTQQTVLQNAEQAYADLADKARQAGVPPGWVR